MSEVIAALQELAGRWEAGLERELPAAVRLRQEVHAHPRVGGAEHDTAARIASAMSGCLDLEPVADTGLIGRLGPAGSAIAVRAELDALPVVEASGASFASTNGAMHACGHDLHLAALVALTRAAEGLELPFALVPVFQPREESQPCGARDIVRAGVLERFGIAHMIGAHVHPGVQTGAVASGGGFVNAAADELDIRLFGRGGHGAYPHLAADPIAAIAQIALALPEVVRRAVSPLHPALISVGSLVAGAGAANVLPAYAHLRATMRTTDPEDRDRLEHAVHEAAEHIAAAFGVRAEVTLVEGEPALVNDVELADRTEEWLTRIGVHHTEPMRSLGADDFAYYLEVVPSIMLFVGVESPGAHPEPALHDARFLPADEHVGTVARAFLAGYLAAAEGLLRADGTAAAESHAVAGMPGMPPAR